MHVANFPELAPGPTTNTSFSLHGIYSFLNIPSFEKTSFIL